MNRRHWPSCPPPISPPQMGGVPLWITRGDGQRREALGKRGEQLFRGDDRFTIPTQARHEVGAGGSAASALGRQLHLRGCLESRGRGDCRQDLELSPQARKVRYVRAYRLQQESEEARGVVRLLRRVDEVAHFLADDPGPDVRPIRRRGVDEGSAGVTGPYIGRRPDVGALQWGKSLCVRFASTRDPVAALPFGRDLMWLVVPSLNPLIQELA
jgi:hypothetical protein